MEKFADFITEAKLDTDIEVAVLTKLKSKKPELVSNLIQKVCKKRGIKCHIINVKQAWINKNDLETGLLTVSNIDGEDTVVEFNTRKTVCFVRAGVLEDEIGIALLTSFERAGAFMVNNKEGMLTCDNKMSAFLSFERNSIPTPKTSIISNEKSLDDALERVGNKYPMIIKSITGTQGIGVSIVDSYESLVSNVQSLWKFGAELLIQEYLKFDYDIRTIVVGGKILASTKRIRPKDDFRSNRHRGATTEPHKLSDAERETILRAARAVGAYVVGVDHALVGDKIYVLECNGSAGIGSNFAMYDATDTESDKNDYVGEAKPSKIVDKLIEFIQVTNNRRHSFPTESGYVERIEVEGYGPLRAKFDTGNGTNASMFVVDKVDIKGRTVRWEKNGKKFTSALQGISKPEHVGKIDERPIVNVNIIFNNRKYIDVPIGLATKDARSNFLANRALMTLFQVTVNPNRRFVLSDWIERGDENAEDDLPTKKMKGIDQGRRSK